MGPKKKSKAQKEAERLQAEEDERKAEILRAKREAERVRKEAEDAKRLKEEQVRSKQEKPSDPTYLMPRDHDDTININTCLCGQFAFWEDNINNIVE